MPTIQESKEFWEHHLEKLKTSGLRCSEYCRNNDISYDRFRYWIKKLNPVSARFIPVKVQANKSVSSSIPLCTLELRGSVLKIYDISVVSFLLERFI
jgi:hypothetical protein